MKNSIMKTRLQSYYYVIDYGTNADNYSTIRGYNKRNLLELARELKNSYGYKFIRVIRYGQLERTGYKSEVIYFYES